MARPRTTRPRRTLLAALVVAAVAVPVAGAASPAEVPAPRPTVPAMLGTLNSASLNARYAAIRDDIEAAERMAAEHGDGKRAASLRAMTATGRQYLSFDGRDGGRSAEVFGDLARAERIAVVVPGADISVDSDWRLRNAAQALHRALAPRSAVIAWTGYRTPSTVSLAVATERRGRDAAPSLNAFVEELTRARPTARISLVCHSYGSVVCAHAASRPGVRDIVLAGSPGTGYRDVAGLHTRATVWAGRGAHDWVADVPHVKAELGFCSVGLGTDPVSPAFGAKRFAAGDGGHSDYFTPGSPALRNIARIVGGEPPVGTSSGGQHA